MICNDPASMMDSYAVIKILHQQYARQRFGIIVNKVKDLQEGYDVFTRFQNATAKFINISMHYLGHIPNDDYIGLSARQRMSVIDKFPQAPSAIASIIYVTVLITGLMTRILVEEFNSFLKD